MKLSQPNCFIHFIEYKYKKHQSLRSGRTVTDGIEVLFGSILFYFLCCVSWEWCLLSWWCIE